MSGEARCQLETFGPNATPDMTVHDPMRLAFEKFWVPIAPLLEVAILLQTALVEYAEAA